MLIANRSGRGLPECGRAEAIEDPEVLRREATAGSHDALLLIRSGAVLRAEALPGFLRALGTAEADGLVPATLLGEDKLLPPLGGSQSFCFYEGAAPGGGLAVKAEALRPVLADRPLAPTCEYFGLADLAVTGGLALWPYAEPVLQITGRPADERQSRRAPERVAAYGRASPTELYYIAAVAQGGYPPAARSEARLRTLRERLYRARLGWAVRLGERVVPRAALEAVLGRRRRGGR